ncbi:hypothetical protein [Absidia glauca]|uniref:Autophagy-related protein 13 n=1 Tax=Absidia glauca TaxID=4829 RepID=A0A168QTX1_ABSGL|nr:hypothetical protein [Absidia glauca]
MQPSARRSRSSSPLQPQHRLVNVRSPIQQHGTATHRAIEDAMDSALFTRQRKKKPVSTVGAQLNGMLKNFYMKTIHVIIQSRRSTKAEKVNKWFCLTMAVMTSLRAELHFWDSKAYYPCEEPPPTLVIHIYLDATHLSEDELFEIMGNYMQRQKKLQAHDKKKVILESWSLTCRQSETALDPSSFDLPSFYKHSITFFRALHSLARLIPGFSLHQRLQDDHKFSLCYRIGRGMCSYLPDELPPDWPLLEGDHQSQSTVYKLSDVSTPIGSLQLKVQYRVPLRTNDIHRMDTHRKVIPASPCIFDIDHHSQQQPTTLCRSQSSPILHEQHDLPSKRGSPGTLLKDGLSLSISPFKSPSLSSIPQNLQQQQASAFKSNPPFVPVIEKSKSSIISYGSTFVRGEFSSSFDKYKTKTPASRHNTPERYLQKSASDFNLLKDLDNGLEDFVRLISTKPDLKLFHDSKWPDHLGPSTLLSDRTPSRTATTNSGEANWTPSTMTCSCENGSLERSKISLDYFHTLRYAHSDLSESMASDLTATNSLPTTPPFSAPSSSCPGGSTIATASFEAKNGSVTKENSTPPDKSALDSPNGKPLQRYQQRSVSSGTKSVSSMGTLTEEDDPS